QMNNRGMSESSVWRSSRCWKSIGSTRRTKSMTSSVDRSPIPVKNIYYMLVYAWDHPHEKDFIQVLGEDEKDLLHLLSKVLLLKVKALIKKGFYKEYAERREEASIIRGKIL